MTKVGQNNHKGVQYYSRLNFKCVFFLRTDFNLKNLKTNISIQEQRLFSLRISLDNRVRSETQLNLNFSVDYNGRFG